MPPKDFLDLLINIKVTVQGSDLFVFLCWLKPGLYFHISAEVQVTVSSSDVDLRVCVDFYMFAFFFSFVFLLTCRLVPTEFTLQCTNYP